MAAGECVRDHVVFTGLVGSRKVIPLQLRDTVMVLAVCGAGRYAAKEILEGRMVGVQVKPVTVEPRAEMLHCPCDCQALALSGTVAALHIGKDATGVPNCVMAAFGILLGEDRSESGAAGIRVEVKLLAKIRLDETRERHQRLLKISKGCVMGRSREVLNIRAAFAFAGKIIERGRGVCEARDVIAKEITSAQV